MAIPKFSNEPVLDFTKPANKKKQLDALKKIKSGLGQEFPILIGSEHIRLDEKFKSFNPSRPAEVVGVFQKGNATLANKAMDVALAAFERWKTVAPAKRAAVLFKAAAIMKKKRFDLNAIMILEVGKTWPEADADTAEAIDFLEYYGREMLRYGEEHPVVKNPGEKGKLVYVPLGVGVVIPPWNFPLAILAGMSSAAIVAGNTVVLKPATDTPWSVRLLIDCFRDGGLPDGVVNFVTGGGSTIGQALIDSSEVDGITFTGSYDVGMHIIKTFASGKYPRPCIAEMGGKNAVIVSRNADVDRAGRIGPGAHVGENRQKVVDLCGSRL